MQELIISIMEQYGYIGITLLIAIENIFPPIPSEIILTFGGFMTTRSSLNVWLVSLFATIGSVLGAIALYYVGYFFSPQRLEWLIDKWGHILRVKKRDIEKAEDWFNRHGSFTVFFCRFVPILRSLISIPAGMSGMNMGKFLLYSAAGTALWNVVLVNLGAYAGSKWETIVDYINTYSHITYALLAIAAIGFVTWFAWRNKPGRNKN